MPSPSHPAAVLCTRAWKGLTVEYGRLDAVGEFDFAMPKQGMSVAFIPHEQVTWSAAGAAPQTTSLPAGSVFLYGNEDFVWHRRTKPSEYVNLLIDPSLVQQLARENGVSASSAFEQRLLFQDPTILHVAQLLKIEVLNDGLAGDLYVESLRNLLVVHLLRHYTPALPKPVQTPTLNSLRLHQLKDYIENHLADDLTIEALAAQIPMSPFHFARAFKAAIGEPPHRYITQRRLERAKILLSVTQLSVAEVAYQTGFSNQSHFTAQFRKTIGMTPKQFRAS